MREGRAANKQLKSPAQCYGKVERTVNEWVVERDGNAMLREKREETGQVEERGFIQH